ncbi:MAG: hypothetical protein VW907_08240, partial [Opitutae bacterium]
MSTVKISEYTGTGSFGYVSSSGKLFAGIAQDSDQSGTNVVVYNPTTGEFEYTGSYIGSDSVLTTASHAITASYLNQPLTEFSSSNISIDGFPDLSASLAGVTTPSTASYAVSASHVVTASYAVNAGISTAAISATNASNAANVYITETNNDSSYGLLFRGTSGDGYQSINADSGEHSPTYNPSTNTLSSTYISASSDLYVGGTLSIDGHSDVSASLADLSTPESASYASTASYVANAVSSSYAVSASHAFFANGANTSANSAFANVATQVVVNNTSNNLNYGLVFRSGDSDGANSLYADSENASPSYNPSTNTLSSTYISASSNAYVSGTLSATSVTASVIAATGKLAILPDFPNVSASLAAAANPATASYAITASYANSATTAGASDFASTAINAVNTTNVDINNTSADDNYGLVFRSGNSGGNQLLYADNQVASPSYNPSTNTLKATYISASSDLYVSGTLSINGYPDVSASLANLVNTNVNISGTPSNNQIAIFTDANTIEGDGNFTWTGTEFRIGSSGDTFKVISTNSVTINDANDDVAFQVKGSSDNNLLQVNPQYTDKIGIGTSTPSEKLTVQGNISASGNIISSHITASGNISASGNLLGGGITINGDSTFNSDNIDLGADNSDRINFNAYVASNVDIRSHITASG